jgi:hypothetical protein
VLNTDCSCGDSNSKPFNDCGRGRGVANYAMRAHMPADVNVAVGVVFPLHTARSAGREGGGIEVVGPDLGDQPVADNERLDHEHWLIA